MGLRGIAIVLAALLTGACTNLVYSHRPLFKPDPSQQLLFKPGLWAAPEPGCVFDSAKPLADWPKCANGQAMDEHGGVTDEHTDIIAGDPIILQGEAREDIQTEPPSQRPAAAAAKFGYTAMDVTARDDAGRVAGFAMWLVQCGPPSPEHYDKRLKHKTTATLHPFAGLVMDGENCWASQAAAVRNAAQRSRRLPVPGAPELPPMEPHWVRAADAP
jgi:hypothetical protein